MVRPEAPADLQKYLFLSARPRSVDEQGCPIPVVGDSTLFASFKRSLADSTDERFTLLRSLSSIISLKKIRVTAGTCTRFVGNFEATREFFNHKPGRNTDAYLRNATYQAQLDDKILEGTDRLLSFLKKKATFVPSSEDPTQVAEKAGISVLEAAALINDEYNTGYGFSLTQGKAFIIGTPLNYLRMKGWLQKMLDAATRLATDNEERWRLYWKPQIELFQSAIADFPRKIRFEASKMSVALSFPDPV